jgi:hypothetical protein
LSALKHGFFKAGFMLCDRCASNAECRHFQPKSRCTLEKEAFVSELMDEFELESVADRILVERAAMYLIRIARAEAYESVVGVSESSALWGGYISRLDNTLRGLLNDLALTRVKRKQSEKNEALLVSLDEVIQKFAKAQTKPRRHTKVEFAEQRVYFAQRRMLLIDWRREYSKLSLTVRRGNDFG